MSLIACPNCGKVGEKSPHFRGGPDTPALCTRCGERTPSREWREVEPPDIHLYAGEYEHYKGGRYVVLGLARHSEGVEPVVIYFPLPGTPAQWWARPLSMWFESVKRGEEWVPRFRFVSGPIEAPEIPLPEGWKPW